MSGKLLQRFCATLLPVISTLLFSSATFAASLQCNKPDVNQRPKIGLVLGGGGARGFAHIGVLKKLEEMRIPYDYITGTSMGSIVGGFVAAGMQSEELTAVVRDADWDDLFQDETAREDLPFRRKADDDLGLFGPKLGIGKDSSLLPKGVVSGQKIVFMFESITSQRVNVENFDALPIPFRAIATDILTGEMAVIGDGELSMAMRASMAVPAVFDPVRRNGALLVDGGLVRNLPVDVARDMGADVVIAVDVGTKLAGESEITSAVAIVYQMSGLLTVHNTEQQIKSLGPTDILISPAIGNIISSADFGKLDEAIPIGYAAADAMSAELQKYSLPEAEYLAWRQQIDNCVTGPPTVHFVHLDNQSRFSDDVIREFITITPGESLDLKQLDHDLGQIYGLGFIRQARYHIVEQDGQQGIKITVIEDERGTQFLETGLELSFGPRGTNFNIRAGYLNTALDDHGSEFRAMVQFGDAPGLFLDYYKPLDNALRFSIQPSLSLFRRPLLLFDDSNNVLGEANLNELGGALTVGYEVARHLGVFAGFTRFKGDLDITVGNPNLSPFKFDGAEWYLEFKYDRLDDRYLPTQGLFSTLKLTRSDQNLGADADYEQIEFSLMGSQTFGRHNFIYGANYNTTLDSNAPVYGLYPAGGFLNMSGYEPFSLGGQHFGMVLAGYRYQVVDSDWLPGYVGMTVEYGNATETRSEIFSNGLLNGSIYFGYNSPLGPIYAGVGLSENRSAIYFISMGAVFGQKSVGRR